MKCATKWKYVKKMHLKCNMQKLFCLGSHFREVNSSLPHAAMTIGHVSRGFATAIVLHDRSSINVNRDYNLLLGTQNNVVWIHSLP